MPIKIKGREAISIEEGKHKGKITATKVESRGKEQYEYLDIYVTVDDQKNSKGEPVTIKAGCPTDLTVNTKLGKLLMNFGITKEQINSGAEFDVEKTLAAGTSVSYLVVNETTEKGTFARIVDGSLKPA